MDNGYTSGANTYNHNSLENRWGGKPISSDTLQHQQYWTTNPIRYWQIDVQNVIDDNDYDVGGDLKENSTNSDYDDVYDIVLPALVPQIHAMRNAAAAAMTSKPIEQKRARKVISFSNWGISVLL